LFSRNKASNNNNDYNSTSLVERQSAHNTPKLVPSDSTVARAALPPPLKTGERLPVYAAPSNDNSGKRR